MNFNNEVVAMHGKLARKEKISSGDLIKLLATNNTITKKFICDYLTDRSHKDANISLITANMLIRDCMDANPCIRSSSIMALSSLPDMEEAAVNLIQKSMKDHSPQVRRACALSCWQLSRHTDPSDYDTCLVDILYDGIRDSDPIVVTNCLLVLEDVLQDEGGIVINKSMVYYLLSRLENFSNSGIIQILNILTKYTPKDEDEILCILNHLDVFFKSDFLAVVLASVKLFFHITENYPKLSQDMVTAIRYSVVNILSKNEFENCAILLDFLLNLNIPLSPVFSSFYKSFMLKFNDSNLIKVKKLKILVKLAEESTVLDIITDLKHYTKDARHYTPIYECLGQLGNISKEAKDMVMRVSISSLSHSNCNMAACSLQCLLKIGICSSDKLHTELIRKMSLALLRPDLLQYHTELSLCVLESYSTVLPHVQQLFEMLYNLMDTLQTHVRCRLLDVTTKCFFQLPMIIQPIIVPMIVKCFHSTDFSEVSCAAFNYALIELKTNV